MVPRCGAALVILGCVLAGAAVEALSPGFDVLVPAVARGAGVGGSLWVTSLTVSNAGSDAATVTVQWLVRDQANLEPTSFDLELAAGETASFDDVLASEFGLDAGKGALRIVADQPVVALASILNRAVGSEFGQGFEAIPTAAALRPRDQPTVLGIVDGSSHRTNLFLVDATGAGSSATVHLLALDGTTLASRSYQLGAFMPILEPLTIFGAGPVVTARLQITVDDGAVIAGASRVANVSGDPVTLPATTPAGAPGVAQCAPPEIVGLSARMVHPIFDGADEESVITITSPTTATLTDGPLEYEATFRYFPFGSGAVVEADIPEINLSNVRATFLCSSETTAAFVAVADSPFGELTIEGTAELIPNLDGAEHGG